MNNPDDADDAAGDGPLSFNELLDRLDGAGQAEKATVGDLVRSFGSRAFGPFLLLPALIAVLPVIGALPGVSLTTAALDFAVALQLLLGQRGLHLPKWARRIVVPKGAIVVAVRMVRPFANWAGYVVRPRLRALTTGGARIVVGVLALLLALLMLIGALIPGGIVLPALAMIILGLGLTSQDGVLILGSLALGIGSAWLGVWWVAP